MLRIAHRGASGTESENTLLAFKRAIQLKVDLIECDLHLTKDNQVVVIHDDTINRTTNGQGKVSELTLAELKQFDAGKGEKIPTLEETIELVGYLSKCRTQLNLEVKDINAVPEVIRIITKTKLLDKTIISSSSGECLMNVKELNPKIRTALIYKATKTDFGQIIFDWFAFLILPLIKIILLGKAKRLTLESINLSKKIASKSMIDFLHQQGLKVMVWTVDEKEEIKRFQTLGTDGIFSNFPERFVM